MKISLYVSLILLILITACSSASDDGENGNENPLDDLDIGSGEPLDEPRQGSATIGSVNFDYKLYPSENNKGFVISNDDLVSPNLRSEGNVLVVGENYQDLGVIYLVQNVGLNESDVEIRE